MSKYDQSCENCRFYDAEYTTKEKHGECKRYPPQVVSLDGEDSPHWYVPEVFYLDRCGEWRPVLESKHISAYEEK